MQENSQYIRQTSGKRPDKSDILSVLVKRTYRISDIGECVYSEIQLPLIDELKFYEDAPNIISADIDLYPYKLFTDVIIKGKATAERKAIKFQSSIEIGDYKLSFLVIGNRKAYLTATGEIRFTDPEPIKEIPLRYDFAYGGRDSFAEEKLKSKLPPPEAMRYYPQGIDFLAFSPYRYRRNTEGKGFLIEFNKRSFENLELPNLEYPENLISPKNLLITNPDFWYKMPIPCSTDWVSPVWFPRIAYFGFYNLPDNISYKLPEIVQKWADEKLLLIKPMQGNTHFRCANGASLGLQLPFIKPGEKIRLTNIHRNFSNFIIRLPSEYPNISVDGRKGRLLETKPVIHTIIIEPNESLISILWRGCASAIRPYHEEELKAMPYKVTWKNNSLQN